MSVRPQNKSKTAEPKWFEVRETGKDEALTPEQKLDDAYAQSVFEDANQLVIHTKRKKKK